MGLQAFGDRALAAFDAAYPLAQARMDHTIAGHPLLAPDELAKLARRQRPETIEHNAAVDLPLGISSAETPSNGLSVHETIARIEECGSWVLLRRIEEDPAYRELMLDVLAQVEPKVLQETGAMLRIEGFVFLSSPRAVTPLHFDPDYNILLQARGTKTVTLFPTADPEIIAQEFFETYFAGGGRNLPWQPEWAARSNVVTLKPGEAVYIPILAPHLVRVHDEVSVSLSLTWRSEWSFHHADACLFNRRLRRLGIKPAPPRLYPANNRLKSYGHRALKRLDRRAS